MTQEGWICPRCGKVNAPWVMQCSCNRNTNILPKVGALNLIGIMPQTDLMYGLKTPVQKLKSYDSRRTYAAYGT